MTQEDRFQELARRLALDLRHARDRIDELEDRRHEPIAVVGIGCRYPGGVDSPESLWELVERGGEGLSDFPTDRGWDLGALFDGDSDTPGTSYLRKGGFLHDAAGFDASFFGISPREATAMDPQQRIALETSWEAVEHARMDPATLRGTSTGVFLGLVAQPYGPPIQYAGEELEGYLLTGVMPAVAAGRVAYSLGLEGPALTVDTACSSSLVALHLAAGSLRAGECDLALAGGVSVYADTGPWVSFSRQRGLAPDGRCKAFSSTADGTSWSEGAGMLLLERLSTARSNGRRVLGVLRGSAVNQDGASSGLAVPNGLAQQRVIRAALADARLAPGDVDLVEAHGTGTTLGDPIEANSLLATYGRDRSAKSPVRVGSLKSNIGHSGAAAGVGGVIKALMAMRNATLPRTLHVAEPSPHVDWDSGALALLTEAAPWPETGRPRRSAVSSFGVSGTNVHVVLEEAPAGTEHPDTPTGTDAPAPLDTPAVPWVLGGRTEAALRSQARRLYDHLAERPGLDPADVGLSLATTRTSFEHRAAVTAADRDDLLRGLRSLAEAVPDTAVVRGAAPLSPRRAVFVFPGQGSQWKGMAVELMGSSHVFAARMADCERALSRFVDWSLSAVLRGEEGAPSLDRDDVVQPALWAVMVSLAELWRAHGVEPSAVVGHSQGEIAAACVAGALSLEDAAGVVALRSRAVLELAGTGAMASVALGADDVRGRLDDLAEPVHVAALNGPAATVVAGDPEGVRRLVKDCESQGVQARLIPVEYASHTPHVERLRERILTALADITPRRPDVPVYSSLTGGPLGDAPVDAEHWYRALRHPVRFEEAVRSLTDHGHTAFLEVGPHPVLGAALQDTCEDAGAEDAVVLPTLHRDEGGADRFLSSVARAYVHGVAVDWTRVFVRRREVDLPTYAFQHAHHWASAPVGGQADRAGLTGADHPMLSAAVSLAETDEHLFTGRIALDTHPWIADHVVLGAVLLPGTAFLEMALHAGDRVGLPRVEELVLHAPLEMPATGGVQIQVRVGAPDASGARPLSVHSRASGGDEGAWTHHAAGLLARAPAAPEDTGTPQPWPPSRALPVPVEDFYPRVTALGNAFGPIFTGMRAAWRDGDDLYAEVHLPASEEPGSAGFGIHPALMDSSQHPLALPFVADTGGGASLAESVGLPFSWSDVTLHASGAAHVRVRVRRTGPDSVSLDLSDPSGRPVATVGSLVTRPITPAQLAAATRTRGDDLFRVEWTAPTGAFGTGAPPAELALLGPDPLGLADHLAEAGHPVTAHDDLTALRGALAAGTVAPAAVLVPSAAAPPEGTAEAAYAATYRALDLLQEWLADDGAEEIPLVLVTRGAVAAAEGDEVPDLDHAPLWGLVRTVQMEFPGRCAIIDVDDAATAGPLVTAVLAGEEPQVALRGGKPLVPRLTRAAPQKREPLDLGSDGTVLVTGANGTVGGVVARHLVNECGARNLLLVSRTGREGTPEELRSELSALGATLSFASCDAADRDALRAVIESVPDDRPLRSVVHIAGTVGGAVFTALTTDHVDHVMRPKVDASINLHELTRDLDLREFVLFSSAASTLGNPGQANYAAANAYLDALAHRRRAGGLPATTIGWGMWAQRSQLTAHLGETDLHRYARMGIAEQIADERGAELFDEALADGAAHLLAVPLDIAGMSQRSGRGADVPTMLRALVRRPRRRAAGRPADSGDLRRRLAGTPTSEYERVLVDLVRSAAAEVLGHSAPQDVPVDRDFLEIGFDSLTAVELRNQLRSLTGLRLPAGLAFKYPTPTAVAGFLLESLPAPDETAPRPREAAGAPEADGRGTPDSLVALFEEFCRQGRTAEGMRLMDTAGLVRPAFSEAEGYVSARGPVVLSSKEADSSVLVCLPSIVLASGPQEFARFAGGVRGLREVKVVPHPGFRDGEPLPDTLAAALSAQADAVARCADGRPFVLVSRSSGGPVAHAVAELLEERGVRPAALALLDPPHPDDEAVLPTTEAQMLQRGGALGIVDSARLTAMGRYMRLFADVRLGAVAAPSVVLRPEDPITDRDGAPIPPFSWAPPHERITVPGDHFTMLEDHADIVARVLHDWLSERGL
ncbi:type I polyketide synthase [Nocardiopsis dassonvillei]|uniref:type I polyketide synthase n=1 Tax=Nocardiopsis dassonvillei TaxID=2014 RepID=UPI00200C112E|nr:type I polyketide synthase [Nocardiopsis dassonvillei]MCK9873257.1 type I polyketide synthase [Nocardiopsis dassonvillei]